jgi:hypothetical protein
LAFLVGSIGIFVESDLATMRKGTFRPKSKDSPMIATADQLAAARELLTWNCRRLYDVTPRGPKPGCPTEAEIAAACSRVQAGWRGGRDWQSLAGSVKDRSAATDC